LGHYNKRCKQEIPENHPLRKYAVTGMGLKYRAHPIAIVIAYELLKNIKNILSVRSSFANDLVTEFQKKYP